MIGCLVLIFLATLPSQAGQIWGLISAVDNGLPTALEALPRRRRTHSGRTFKFAKQVDYKPLRDVVVYIGRAASFNGYREPLASAVIAHKHAAFVPRVFPILVGTMAESPHLEDIRHEAFSFSKTKPFNLGLYRNEVKGIKSDKPGRADVSCSIHRDMHSIVSVFEHPYLSQTDRTGDYIVSDLPAGLYRIKAWNERLPPQLKEARVPENGTIQVDFKLGVYGLPEY